MELLGFQLHSNERNRNKKKNAETIFRRFLSFLVILQDYFIK